MNHINYYQGNKVGKNSHVVEIEKQLVLYEKLKDIANANNKFDRTDKCSPEESETTKFDMVHETRKFPYREGIEWIIRQKNSHVIWNGPFAILEEDINLKDTYREISNSITNPNFRIYSYFAKIFEYLNYEYHFLSYLKKTMNNFSLIRMTITVYPKLHTNEDNVSMHSFIYPTHDNDIYISNENVNDSYRLYIKNLRIYFNNVFRTIHDLIPKSFDPKQEILYTTISVKAFDAKPVLSAINQQLKKSKQFHPKCEL